MTDIANVTAVARREYTTRVRTRSFIFGTVVLVVAVVAMALLPVIVGYLDRNDSVRAAVHTSVTDLPTDPVATLSVLLNASSGGSGSNAAAQPDFVVSAVPDLAVARQAVIDGTYAGVLDIARGSDGQLVFTLYTNADPSSRQGAVVRQAANAIAVADRLARAGIAPSQQAGMFAPPTFDVAWPDPARTDPVRGTTAVIGQSMLGFGMTILIFMMIILYGQWIAMSVVEEKSSRVMEVVLNAATPFQLLSGKVLGVGAVAGTQYLALLAAGGAALLAQNAVARAVLGDAASAGLPQGLTPDLLLLFGVYGVLGFLLFAVLYAAAASLVSRQEDVNAIVMPMTLIASAGYLVGVYASMGLLDIQAGWITVLAQVPLVSPFMMLARVTAEQTTVWEVLLSIGLLVLAIVGALWLAARVYAAGVLLYGQRPSAREVWRLVRSGA
jgi:ABC-2 type transport system permease protein